MSLKNQIHDAYDKVHAPEEVIERLKQELHRKETSKDAEHEIYRVARKSRPQLGGHMMYIAAVIAVCFGAGIAWQSIQQYRNPIRPGMAVYTEAPSDDPSLAEGVVPDVTHYYYDYAKKVLEQYGYECVRYYESSDELEDGIVIRTEPAALTKAAAGSTVRVYVAGN